MPARFDRCVQHVTRNKGVKNAYAVCRASMGSDAEIKARARDKQDGETGHTNTKKKKKKGD